MTPSKFEELSVRWCRDTIFVSSIRTIMAHPAVDIFRLDPVNVIDYIVEVFRTYDGINDFPEVPILGFLVLLNELTGADPVPPESRGRIKEMVNAWIIWYDRIYDAPS